MVVTNQKKNLSFGENNSPEINLNSNLKRWFSRNIGFWKSKRTYFLNEVQVILAVLWALRSEVISQIHIHLTLTMLLRI